VIDMRMVFSCMARAPSADVPGVRGGVPGGESLARHAEENTGPVLRGAYQAAPKGRLAAYRGAYGRHAQTGSETARAWAGIEIGGSGRMHRM
jgi:hypothetical protein